MTQTDTTQDQAPTSINPEYVAYLEKRVQVLEQTLTGHGSDMVLPKGVKLSPKQSVALSTMMARNGRIVTKDMLFHALHGNPENPPTMKSLDVLISQLRARVRQWITIETVHGRGYRLPKDYLPMLRGETPWKEDE